MCVFWAHKGEKNEERASSIDSKEKKTRNEDRRKKMKPTKRDTDRKQKIER